MSQVRDIGIDVRAPEREPAPGDVLNPFNGSLPVRGSTIVGNVVSTKMLNTVIVEKVRPHLVEKFQRFEKRTSRYAAHLPSNIDATVGDEVLIAECRPISKTVKFVVVENRGGGERPQVVAVDAGEEEARAAAAAAITTDSEEEE